MLHVKQEEFNGPGLLVINGTLLDEKDVKSNVGGTQTDGPEVFCFVSRVLHRRMKCFVFFQGSSLKIK